MTGTGGERLFRKSFQVEKLGTPHPRPRVSSQAGGESLSPRLSYGVRVQGREARSEGQEKKGEHIGSYHGVRICYGCGLEGGVSPETCRGV